VRQVEQVSGQEADDVNSELPRVDVVAAKLVGVRNDKSLFQIRFTQNSSSYSYTVAWRRQNFAPGGTGAWRTGSKVRGDSHPEVKAVWP